MTRPVPDRSQASRSVRDPQCAGRPDAAIIAIACPQIVYPYLRATVADVINRTGFPPVHLTEVNFQAMYEAQLQQAADRRRQRLSGWAPASRHSLKILWERARGARRWPSAPRGTTRVLLWARDAAQVADMQATRCNTRYLPTHRFLRPCSLSSTTSPKPWRTRAAPKARWSSSARPWRRWRHAAACPITLAALWLCKGFEKGSGRLGHEIARHCAPGLQAACSGPSFAHEVALGQPTALVAASTDTALAGRPWMRSTPTACASTPPRPDRGGGGWRRQERAGHCHRHCRRLEPGPERARRADHAGPGRDDPPGRGPGRPSPTPSWACRAWAIWS
jgi:hypothetical protein